MTRKMKRIVLFCILITLMLNTSLAQTDNAAWMASLPDSAYICRLSIPGTHDSGTAGVRFPMKHYARTQTMDLAEQWDAGIRFFDLRPKLEDGLLKIYHGPANCHITFEEALLVLKQKIEKNPTEFCIVMTNSAGGGQTAVDKTMELIRQVIPVAMLADFKAEMTVADIRGRILFIHRNAPSAGVHYPGVVTRGWYENGLSHQARMVSDTEESAVLWMQDCFTTGNNDAGLFLRTKWDIVRSQLSAFAKADDGIWCINHASGYTGTGVRTNIRRNSDSMNAWIMEFLGELDGPIGIIPMDFPQQELIDAIIFLNTFAAE